MRKKRSTRTWPTREEGRYSTNNTIGCLHLPHNVSHAACAFSLALCVESPHFEFYKPEFTLLLRESSLYSDIYFLCRESCRNTLDVETREAWLIYSIQFPLRSLHRKFIWKQKSRHFSRRAITLLNFIISK